MMKTAQVRDGEAFGTSYELVSNLLLVFMHGLPQQKFRNRQ